MNANAFAQLAVFDLKQYSRNMMSLFWVLAYPLLMLFLFGTMYGNEPTPLFGGHGFIDTYIPALCSLNVLSVAVFTLNIQMASYRENGVLRRFKAAPVRPWMVLGSNAVQGVVLVILGSLEIVAAGMLVYDVEAGAKEIVLLLAFLLLGCLCFFSLGFALSGLGSGVKTSNGIAMGVFFPMMFLSGVAFPIEVMPDILQAISKFLPMTYMVDLLQSVWYGEEVSQSLGDIAVIAGFGIVCAGLAVRLFRWE
ncbi:ABC transporter permease [Paenibacillus thermotolerans]|uniref:ABC transporter permease n=1 Tax=Paenibacillus thermotolerans TaxID=3027807 RepID=UPI002368D6C5|nr:MULTISPECIES: ABC transporter permease [unclassified Paenibacillus]